MHSNHICLLYKAYILLQSLRSNCSAVLYISMQNAAWYFMTANNQVLPKQVGKETAAAIHIQKGKFNVFSQKGVQRQ